VDLYIGLQVYGQLDYKLRVLVFLFCQFPDAFSDTIALSCLLTFGRACKVCTFPIYHLVLFEVVWYKKNRGMIFEQTVLQRLQLKLCLLLYIAEFTL
jgi:hypothetical protein